jgi:hypothetical protein
VSSCPIFFYDPLEDKIVGVVYSVETLTGIKFITWT